MERDRNNRRAYDTGSFTPFTIDSSKVQRIPNHGVSNLKYKYGNRHFWAEGYYVSTVGLNTATIQKYIREQEKEDQIMDKLKAREYSAPFKGSKKSVLLGLNNVKASHLKTAGTLTLL